MCGEGSDQAVQERLPVQFQKRLGIAHAARLSGGQNQPGHLQPGGGHFSRCARSDSSSDTDLDSARQLEVAPRRTAIISAATDTAISSGEMAPMGLEIGAISPEEIAVSVAAEIIAVRRGATSNWRALSKSVSLDESLRAHLLKSPPPG